MKKLLLAVALVLVRGVVVVVVVVRGAVVL